MQSFKKIKPTPGCMIAGSFKDYTLSRRSGGLTNISTNKMTKVISNDVDDSNTLIDLGFDFYFNGTKFSQIRVSTNGYITLGSHLITEYVSLLNAYKASQINSTITVDGALFCVWFNDQRTLKESVPSLGPLGGVYYYKEYSSEGVRGIIRWVNSNYYNSGVYSATTIIYECCLYEKSGKIEFRYSKIWNNPSLNSAIVEPVGNSAAIGIFSTGTNNFRDFSRNEIENGGAIYRSTYSYTEGIETTAYSWNNRVFSIFDSTTNKTIYGNWKEIIYEFNPPISSRRNLPRNDINLIQNNSYIFDKDSNQFNDLNTIKFGNTSYDNNIENISTSSVNFPTTLSQDYIQSIPIRNTILNSSKTSLTVRSPGEQVGISTACDYYVKLNKAYNESKKLVSPFNESYITEQGIEIKETNFYNTGSTIDDYMIGYSDNIGSKQIIRLQLPILSETLLRPTTSSMYYYDSNRKTIMQFGGDVLKDPGSEKMPNALSDTIGFSPFGTFCSTVKTKTFNKDFIHDVLEDQFDIDYDKYPIDYPNCAAGWGLPVTTNNRSYSLMSKNEGSPTLSSLFNVHKSGTISLENLIEGSFLVEKVIMKLPIAAGPGWTQDKTRIKRSIGFNDFYMEQNLPSVIGSLFSSDWPLDIGGPCVTVGLMNQIGSTEQGNVIRDIVVTGTFIPEVDTISSYRIDLAKSQQIVDFNNVSSTLNYWSITPEGYTTFNLTPSAIVKSNNSGYYTGSVEIKAEVIESAGHLYQSMINTRNYGTQNVSFSLDNSDPYETNHFSPLQMRTWNWEECNFNVMQMLYVQGSVLGGGSATQISPPRLYLGAYGSEYINLNLSMISSNNSRYPNLGGNAYVVGINPYGRSKGGFELTSGRSFRKLIPLSNNKVKNPLYQFIDDISTFILTKNTQEGTVSLRDYYESSLITTDQSRSQFFPDVILPVESSKKSPYLLNPKDQLVFFISKTRPVKSASLSHLKDESGYGEEVQLVPGQVGGDFSLVESKYSILTGSHDIKVTSGILEITLFGSYINCDSEYSKYNSNKKKIYSETFSDSISSIQCLDQNDIEYSDSYTGSYSSRIIDGSMFAKNVYPYGTYQKNYIGVRGLIDDSTNTNSVDQRFDLNLDISTRLTKFNERRGSFRFAQAHDYHERYWDTLLPSITDIWKADNKNVYYKDLLYRSSQGDDGVSYSKGTAVCYIGPQPRPYSNVFHGSDEWTELYTGRHYECSSSLNFTNTEWTHAYPFESRYSNIIRKSYFTNTKFETSKIIIDYGRSDASTNAEISSPTQANSYHLVDKVVLAYNVYNYEKGYSSDNHYNWFPMYSGLNIMTSSIPQQQYSLSSEYGDDSGRGNTGQLFYDYREFVKTAFGYSSIHSNLIDPASGKNEYGNKYYRILSGGPASDSLLDSSLYNRPLRMKFRSKTPSYYGYLDDPNPIPPNAFEYYTYGMMIEGWKYGIMNGFRQTSKVVYRQNSYGQFRDMLEQRLFGKYFYETVDTRVGTTNSDLTGSLQYHDISSLIPESEDTITESPVQVKFIDSKGKLTDPHKTDSSNMSNEATSSLPYFDNQVRNRPSEWTYGLSSEIQSVGKSEYQNLQSVRNKQVMSLSTDTFGNLNIR